MIKQRIISFYKTRIKKMNCSDINIEAFCKAGGHIGKNTNLFSNPFASEPQLVTVGDNCTISSDVFCVTHDASIGQHIPGKTDVFGEIKIGNNCFIGKRAMLMYGVTIGDNSIIAAGSVVTRSVPEGSIVAGNPARCVGNVKDFAEKYKDKAVNWRDVDDKINFFKTHPEILVKR